MYGGIHLLRLTSGNILGSLMGGETIGLDKKRSYSAKAYLDDTVRSRINPTVWTKATVERIIFENSDSDTPIAVGVTVRDSGTGTLKSVLANKEAILSGAQLILRVYLNCQALVTQRF